MSNGWDWSNWWQDFMSQWRGDGMQTPYRPAMPYTGYRAPVSYAGPGAPDWGAAGMPQYIQRGPSLPLSGVTGGRGAPFAGWGAPAPAEPVPGQYTPSQGFGMLPPPTRATPGRIPTTTVEQALADVVATAIGSFGPQQQAIMGQAQQGGTPGPWGGEMGRYPVPWGAIEGMPSWRREWEEWSWSERGIPLQGHEIQRLSRNVPPWGRAPYPE